VRDAVAIANAGGDNVAGAITGHNFDIVDPSGAPNLPNPIFPQLDQGATGADGAFTIPAGGYYLVVKYDGNSAGAGGMIFVVDGHSGAINVPTSFGTTQFGPNHFVLFGAQRREDPRPTPDGGSTAALLGLGVMGLMAARKRS
jgi:hypothetical protein